MKEESPRSHGTPVFAIGCLVLLLLLLPFMPLGLAYVEHTAWGTNHVEDFCRKIGVHGILSKLYDFVFRFFKF